MRKAAPRRFRLGGRQTAQEKKKNKFLGTEVPRNFSDQCSLDFAYFLCLFSGRRAKSSQELCSWELFFLILGGFSPSDLGDEILHFYPHPPAFFEKLSGFLGANFLAHFFPRKHGFKFVTPQTSENFTTFSTARKAIDHLELALGATSRTMFLKLSCRDWHRGMAKNSGIFKPMVCQTYGLHAGRLSLKTTEITKTTKMTKATQTATNKELSAEFAEITKTTEMTKTTRMQGANQRVPQTTGLEIPEKLVWHNFFLREAKPWAHSEGHPDTERTFTGTLVNAGDLRRNSGECRGGSCEYGVVGSPKFAKLRQGSPKFA